jgi:heat shock protein HslJ
MRKTFLLAAFSILMGSFSMAAFAQGPIEGEWLLSRITIDGSNVPLVQGKASPSAKFDKEDNIHGNGGCNAFGGRFERANGGRIKFAAFISTKMACAQEVNTQESLYLGQFEKIRKYALTTSSLILSDDAGEHVLTFVPKPKRTIVLPTSAVELADQSGSTDRTILWIVDKQKVDCPGVRGGEKCLQVKTADYKPWEVLRDSIRGFDYQPGRYYLIRVKRVVDTTSRLEAQPYHYELVQIVSHTKLMEHVD